MNEDELKDTDLLETDDAHSGVGDDDGSFEDLAAQVAGEDEDEETGSENEDEHSLDSDDDSDDEEDGGKGDDAAEAGKVKAIARQRKRAQKAEDELKAVKEEASDLRERLEKLEEKQTSRNAEDSVQDKLSRKLAERASMRTVLRRLRRIPEGGEVMHGGQRRELPAEEVAHLIDQGEAAVEAVEDEIGELKAEVRDRQRRVKDERARIEAEVTKAYPELRRATSPLAKAARRIRSDHPEIQSLALGPKVIALLAQDSIKGKVSGSQTANGKGLRSPRSSGQSHQEDVQSRTRRLAKQVKDGEGFADFAEAALEAGL